MLDPHSPEFSRNLGFFSIEEQERLQDATVVIAGAGGDGGALAVSLARNGVGTLRLADPDPFEAENINRQAVCTTATVGENKAEAVGRYISNGTEGGINPNIKVEIFNEGINEDNVEEFVKGADLVIDETEFTLHALGVMLARAARKEGVPNLMAMNIGWGATVTSFHPNNGMTFEKMLGLSEEADIDEISEAQVDISRWLPYIPPYADLSVFKKVATEEKSAPSISQGVNIAAGIASTQAQLHLWNGRNNRPKPLYAPKVGVFDAMTMQSHVVKLGKSAHYRSIMRMAVNNALHRVPKASY